MPLSIAYDRQADALYARLSDRPYAFGEDFDHARRVDYARDGTPIGIELLYVSQGVDLTSLPMAKELAIELKKLNIRELA